jgi:hypothetical protein
MAESKGKDSKDIKDNNDAVMINTSPIQNASEVIELVKKTNLASTFVLSLNDITNKVFANTRTDCSGDHVANIAGTIGDNLHNEQLTAVNATLVEKDGKSLIAIYAGFTRFEAMQRLALEKLIEEWNAENKLTPNDSNYIEPFPDYGYEAQKDREKILSAGSKWAEKYIAALTAYPIKVEIVPNLRDFQLFCKSFIENTARENLPAWNIASNLQELKERFKVSWKIIAEKTGFKQQTISQYNAIFAVPSHLKTMFDEDKEKLNLTDSDRKLVTICCDEFVRRSSLPVKDPCAVQLSHGRILGQALSQRDNNGITFKDAIALVSALCKVNKDGTVNPKAEAANYTVFDQLVSNAKDRKNALKPGDFKDELSDIGLGETSIKDLSKLQVSEDVKAALSLSEKEDKKSDVIDMESIMKQVGEQLKKESTIEASDKKAEKTSSDKPSSATELLMDDDDVLEGSGVSSDILSDLESDDDGDDDSGDVDLDEDDLLAGIVGSSADSLEKRAKKEEENEEEDETGEKRTTTIKASEELKVKSVDKITEKISVAKILLTTVVEEGEDDPSNINWIEVVSGVSAIVSMTEVIGDKSNHKKFSKMSIEVCDSVSKIMSELIAHAKKSMNAEQFSKISSLFTKVSPNDFE